MKVAVIGSRGLTIDILEAFLPPETTEIVSGGAKGIDICARKFAEENEYRYTEFLPDYKAHGRVAPLRRNDQIIEYSDLVLAFGMVKAVAPNMSLTVARSAVCQLRYF